MRSKTSFFNATLFFKTVSRFWPLWLAYLGIWVLLMPMNLHASLRWNDSAISAQRQILSGAIEGGLIFGVIAAVLAVMAVWSFLYNARSMSGTASLPLRREGVFLSVSLAGLLPLLATHVLVALLTLGILGLHGVPAVGAVLQWLAVVSLILLFFYGFALLCAQLTGNILVLPVVYTVLNFTAYVVEAVVTSLLSVFVYGLDATGNMKLEFLSPAIRIYSRLQRRTIDHFDPVKQTYETVGYYLDGWSTLIVYALVGVALAGFALWLYRRRKMETAGDVVAIEILKPVFKYCLSFGCALVLGMLLYSFFRLEDNGQLETMLTLLGFMVLGAFIGYFAAEMLIHKSFRVWRGHWRGLGISLAVMALLMFAMEFDLFGYERRVPETGEVENVMIRASGENVLLEDPENIAAAIALHESIIENKTWHEGAGRSSYSGAAETVAVEDIKYVSYVETKPVERSQNCWIDYQLSDGRTLSRRYTLRYVLGDPATYGDTLTLQQLLNCQEAIDQRKATAFALTAENIIDGYVRAQIFAHEVEGLEGVYGGMMDFYDVKTGEYLDDLRWAEEGHSYYGTCTWEFTAEELEELYYTCILPDIADGTLGRIWLITDGDYYSTVYNANINIDGRIPRPKSKMGEYAYEPYLYEYFDTHPTVDSVRTNAWLREHGIPLHTHAEFQNAGK